MVKVQEAFSTAKRLNYHIVDFLKLVGDELDNVENNQHTFEEFQNKHSPSIYSFDIINRLENPIIVEPSGKLTDLMIEDLKRPRRFNMQVLNN